MFIAIHDSFPSYRARMMSLHLASYIRTQFCKFLVYRIKFQISRFYIYAKYMSTKDAVKKISLIKITEERLQCAVCSYLVVGPLQFNCGHRICTSCARQLKQESAVTFFCHKCQGIINFTDYFHDKAVAREIESTIIDCPHCSWTGIYSRFQEHLKEECQMIEVSCPHNGCNEISIRSEIDDHVQKYLFKNPTSTSPLNSPNHLVSKEKLLIRQCTFSYMGCQFEGSKLQLSTHMENDVHSHLSHICNYLSTHSVHKAMNGFQHVHDHDHQALQSLLENAKVDAEQTSSENGKTKLLVDDLQGLQKDMACRLNAVEDLLITIQANITEINRTYEEVSLTLQTLQATSYDGKYIWKIPDITRRRKDAVTGKTVSLYSAPFYTDRFGYRMCLRVYLDGDGSGKGRYVSYFLTIMKGEYDALLEWPFQLAVTMTMINQKGNGNITQSFKPNPSSASFHRPKADMNVASGCPKFAALSVLDNPEFVVDDVAFFQCTINAK